MFGQPRFLFTSLDSTNSEAMRRIKLGASFSPHGCSIITDEQTQGRGRNGRLWHTMPHNSLAMSVIFRPTLAHNIAAINATQLSLVAAVAIHKALVTYAPEAKIKWPNDILVNNKKLCGILMELYTKPDNTHDIDAIVLGVGINISAKPNTQPYQSCALSDYCNNPPQANILADAICQQLDDAWQAWLKYGFLPFRRLWQQAHAMQNEMVQVDSNDGKQNKTKVCGIARGLDNDGALLLDVSNGQRQRIIAGDVHAHLSH
ncbi:MAG: biotin--[acetyl-CoA-carboxylase] ligase [Mariprofundales bacterium]